MDVPDDANKDKFKLENLMLGLFKKTGFQKNHREEHSLPGQVPQGH